MFRFVIAWALISPVLLLADQGASVPAPTTLTPNEQVPTNLQTLISEGRWRAVNRQVRAGIHNGSIALTDLQTLAAAFPGTPFATAVSETQELAQSHPIPNEFFGTVFSSSLMRAVRISLSQNMNG